MVILEEVSVVQTINIAKLIIPVAADATSKLSVTIGVCSTITAYTKARNKGVILWIIILLKTIRLDQRLLEIKCHRPRWHLVTA